MISYIAVWVCLASQVLWLGQVVSQLLDVPGYLQFRDRRLEKIWEIVSSIVDPEQSSRLYQS